MQVPFRTNEVVTPVVHKPFARRADIVKEDNSPCGLSPVSRRRHQKRICMRRRRARERGEEANITAKQSWRLIEDPHGARSQY